MMRLCRASVIVVLSLLTSAATAHAECAWGLWIERGNWKLARRHRPVRMFCCSR
jgi:hypothetical protein